MLLNKNDNKQKKNKTSLMTHIHVMFRIFFDRNIHCFKSTTVIFKIIISQSNNILLFILTLLLLNLF